MNDSPKRSASIKDVASLAKTSVSTVSRYLNQTGPVRQTTKQRIESAIKMLDYQPNPFARALVTDQINTIAVFCGSITLYGQTHTIEGIQQQCAQAGYAINVIALGDATPESIDASVKGVLRERPAGVIIIGYDTSSVWSFHSIPKNTPKVLISGSDHNPGVAQLYPEEYATGRLLTEHLISLGHRRLAYVGYPGLDFGVKRYKACLDACQEAGIPAPQLFHTTWNPYDARQLGHTFADSPFTAVLAGNDELAMGLIRGFKDIGLEVPHDISVTGFDDHPLADVCLPSLTTVRQNFNDIGRQATTMLLELITDMRGDGNTQLLDAPTVLPSELIIRESTAHASR